MKRHFAWIACPTATPAITLGLSLVLTPVPASGQAVLPPNGPGGALSFDGVNDHVTAAPPSLPTGNSPYTIEAWIRPDTMGALTIAAWGNFTANQANAFRLTPTGLVNYLWANDLFVDTTNLATAWHHVAAPSTGYVLQQTANMNGPGGGWTNVTQPPVVVGSNQEVTLPATGRFCVFRLRGI